MTAVKAADGHIKCSVNVTQWDQICFEGWQKDITTEAETQPWTIRPLGYGRSVGVGESVVFISKLGRQLKLIRNRYSPPWSVRNIYFFLCSFPTSDSYFRSENHAQVKVRNANLWFELDSRFTQRLWKTGTDNDFLFPCWNKSKPNNLQKHLNTLVV